MALTLTEKYRKTFNSPEGQDVLRDLLDECNFFSLVQPGEDTLILRNFAMKILAKLGITDRSDIVQALMCLPYTDIDKDTRRENERV